MCCFSRNIKAVADTNIFARASEANRQFLVYGMKVDTPMSLAMILPVDAATSAVVRPVD